MLFEKKIAWWLRWPIVAFAACDLICQFALAAKPFPGAAMVAFSPDGDTFAVLIAGDYGQ